MPCYLPDWLRGDKWLTNFLLRFSILFSLVLYLECPPPPFPTRLPGVPGNRVPNGGTLYFTCIPGAQRGQRASNTNRHERQSNGWNIYIYIYYDQNQAPTSFKTPPSPHRLFDFQGSLDKRMHFLLQLSDLVPLRNGFYSFRAQTD